MKRNLVLCLCALASACVGEISGTEDEDRQTAAKVAALASRTLPVGDFVLDWNESASQLRVTHRDEPERVIWESLPRTPFLTAAQGKESVGFARGSFSFADSVSRRCERQTVDELMSQGDGVALRGRFSDCNVAYEIFFRQASQDHLTFSVDLADPLLNRTYLTYASDAKEGFFGFGAQYSGVNMKGKRLPVWSEEQGHGRGLEPITTFLKTFGNGANGDWYTTYTAVPYYVTNRARSLFLENTEYAVFDMQASDRVNVEVWAGALQGQILHGTTPAKIVQTFTESTGRMNPLPTWTQDGPIVRMRGGSQAVRAALLRAKSFGVPVSAFWIEDWAGERETAFGRRMWWNWVVDRSRYPDWEALIQELKRENVRVLCYFNPFLADVSEKSPAADRNLFVEMRDLGYLVKQQDGTPYLIGSGGFDAGLVDLTNPQARSMLKGLMKAQIENGVSGWMADFGEALAYDAKVFSGADPRWFHNEFPYEWAKLNREVMEETDMLGEGLFFNRSGNLRSPGKSLLFWLGDQMVTWDEKDGLKTVVPGLLSAGLSGYSLEHIDTGGWLSLQVLNVGYRRTKELWQRSLELSTFTPVIRTHTTQQPNWNHQWDSDDDTTRHFARMSKVFRALAPYRARLMQEAKELGLPVVRHPMLDFPADKNVYELTRQFMLGDQLMVAPILDKGATRVRMYLPEGRWTHLWTSRVEEVPSGGRWLDVEAPVGKPAVYLRNGQTPDAEILARLRSEGVL